MGYRKLRVFEQTRCHVSFPEFSIQNDWSQVAELVRGPTTMLKILSVGPPIFLNIMLDTVSLCTGKKTYSFIGWGWIIWDWKSKFNKFIDLKVAGALRQGLDSTDMSILLVSLNFFGICVCFLRHNSGTSLLLWREGTLWQFSLKMRIFFDCFNRMKRKRESRVSLTDIFNPMEDLPESNLMAVQGRLLAVSVTQNEVMYNYFLRKCRFFKKHQKIFLDI